MLAKFRSKKQSILAALQRPYQDYEDLSPKGNVDEEIRELIEEINSLPDYVTTSSCAGRVAVYLEGEGKSAGEAARDGEQEGMQSSANGPVNPKSGKGGGKWLFNSHQPVEIESLSAPGSLFAKLGLPSTAEIAFPQATSAARFVHLKFEPMILHVLAGSAESAQTMLGAGMAAGFRESGTSGIVDSKGHPSAPMVAIRSSGLAMDCIIGFQPSSITNDHTRAPHVQPMVSEDYLRTVIVVVNNRFKQNILRKERFRQSMLMQFAGSLPVQVGPKAEYRRKGGYQTASERKAQKRADDMRKREEALERRAQTLQRGGALDGTMEDVDGDDSDDLTLDVLHLDEDGNRE